MAAPKLAHRFDPQAVGASVLAQALGDTQVRHALLLSLQPAYVIIISVCWFTSELSLVRLHLEGLDGVRTEPSTESFIV
jgi:hypothetical protein